MNDRLSNSEAALHAIDAAAAALAECRRLAAADDPDAALDQLGRVLGEIGLAGQALNGGMFRVSPPGILGARAGAPRLRVVR